MPSIPVAKLSPRLSDASKYGLLPTSVCTETFIACLAGKSVS